MDDIIIISNLNDFIFCPASIYFHKLYGSQDNLTYQSSYQINGSRAHESVDNSSYSTKKSIITALDVYSDKYKLSGNTYYNCILCMISRCFFCFSSNSQRKIQEITYYLMKLELFSMFLRT